MNGRTRTEAFVAFAICQISPDGFADILRGPDGRYLVFDRFVHAQCYLRENARLGAHEIIPVGIELTQLCGVPAFSAESAEADIYVSWVALTRP